MAPKDGKTLYDALDPIEVPAEEAFSLEEILSEYGGGLGNRLIREAEAEEPSEKPPKETLPTVPEEAAGVRDKLLAQAVDLEKLEEEVLPPSPRPISLEEVVGSTVSAVMEERQAAKTKAPRCTLFSRRSQPETEELYTTMERSGRGAVQTEEEPYEEEHVGPEREPGEAADEYRTAHHRARGSLGAAVVTALLPTLLLILHQQGIILPYVWSEEPKVQSIMLLACLAVTAMLCRSVFVKAARRLLSRRVTAEVLISVSAVLSALDCVVRITSTSRADAMPYAAVSALALVFALWGDSRECRAYYDTFRTAAMDETPPYLVAESQKGACKQRGSVEGFYTTAMRSDAATVLQTAFLPLVFMASLVFAGLTTLGRGQGANFLLHWSAILAAGGTFALPLCWALPYSKLAQHLQKTGCAVAGWVGAEKISRKRCMILTDTDLFPPGTVELLGVKTLGEESRKVASYAAALTRAAGSGLERVFDEHMRREDGTREKVDDFNFFEEGGWSATIRGESVLLGTESFMRKMDVRLPLNHNLKTGMFLALDGELAAIFAVKYHPADNVDFALRMMQRSHITPILASRDPNLVPALLKRKFHKGVKVEYPAMLARIAYSETEKSRGLPRAVLLREGLLPYAETVAGSRRLCQATLRASMLSVAGSIVGTLLAAYLVSLGSYSLLTPLALEVFLLLWTVPVLLLTDWAGRY